MARVCILTFAVMFGYLITANGSTLASKPQSAAKSKPSSAKPKSAPRRAVRVDPTARELDAGYKGEAFADVLKLFSASAKGEFESSAEYEARLAKLPFGIYAFRVDEPEISYDADAEVMRIKVANSLAYTQDPMQRWYEFEGAVTPTGTYVGQNAYGTKAEVTKARSSRLLLIDRDSSMDSADAWVGEFSIKAPEARALKPKLAVLLLADIDADAAKTIEQETHETTATVSSPYEFSITEHRVTARIAGWWVVDTSTGNIVYRTESTH